MTVTVLVPDEEGVIALSEIEGVRPVVYRPGEPVPAEAAEAEVLVTGGRPTEAMWRELPNVKLVQLLVAGAEDWIGNVPDGVLLSTCRGAHGGSSAEWVVAVLLAMYRGLHDFADGQRRKRWERRTTDTLQGKRVLIVGAGDLGRHLRRRLETFDVRCTMVGTTSREGVHAVGELPRLLPEHDVTVLMVPLTQHTRGLVDAEFLAAMPDGAILVNVSRGPVVRTDALVAELASGRLRAALDVTDPEPLPEGHPLWDVPGLLLTPHVGGAVSGVRQRAYAVVVRELSHYLGGELPKNLVHGEY
ncbi:2-hydroxyacid dehydrogenase [Amycolatopsis regifaucium]|uniref:Phosphoglycerate dehydrogenase n=1 Tax=Amycolatopsis regifaucium TaxID=546365 RepID=A0A154MEF0_9PSEU|nr:2-hydroxyacid dehydrogenase [Amycolatopsis regifaucium]KZB82517.1 phosphoglycerate dehydrogenase [Amycolatopsis regifaucium]OKA06990.1 phosphoglycerate dehydrogenase [Amycolatopsis regifaucium]SFH29397.1 Phosphoglycerate dehydrogenase [Amycolatopsis regifaucium]